MTAHREDDAQDPASVRFEDLYDVLGRGAARVEATTRYDEAARLAVEGWQEHDGTDVIVLTVTGHGARVMWTAIERRIQGLGIPAISRHGHLTFRGVADAGRGESTLRILPAAVTVTDGLPDPSLLVAFAGANG